jgi:hypothetical protein
MNTIKYSLVPNRLNTSVEIPYLPRTVLNGSLSGPSLINAICWGSTVTPADCKAVLENLNRVVTENLSQGRSVNLEFVNLRPSVKGFFDSPDETFQKEKHKISISVSATGEIIRKVNLEATPTRVVANRSEPNLTSWVNLSIEGSVNPSVGQLIEVRGSRLRFDKNDPRQGIFFIKDDGSSIRATEYSNIGGNRVSLKLPEGIEPGESLRLQARSLFGSVVRSGELDYPIISG